jgi:hypothetical protein
MYDAKTTQPQRRRGKQAMSEKSEEIPPQHQNSQNQTRSNDGFTPRAFGIFSPK